MRTVINTSVWSLLVRRRDRPVSPRQDASLRLLREAARIGDALLLGPVRQEVLTGLRPRDRFALVRDRLHGFVDEPLVTEDFERAALFDNECRAVGLQGAPTDFVVCAVASRLGAPILTLDHDFERYRHHLPIELVDLPDG